MKKLIIVTSLILSFKTFALNAYLEPFVGYQFSNQRTEIVKDTSVSIADETSFETTGIALGARLGIYVLPYLTIGLDLKTSNTTGEGQGKYYKQTTIERKLKEQSVFATLAYTDGIFKYWLGVGVYGSYTDSGDYNEDGEQSLSAGTSYKIGLGYNFSTNFSVNIDLELINTKTTTEKDNYFATMDYDLGDAKVTNALISFGYRFNASSF